jgi:hypothetical protein
VAGEHVLGVDDLVRFHGAVDVPQTDGLVIAKGEAIKVT